MAVKSVVNSRTPFASSRCADIRERLEDFAARRLGPTARGEVQGHLLTCDACGDALADLLMNQVEEGSLPLLVPPEIPPPTVYEAYLRARRPITSWQAILDAMVDPGTREWAANRIEEIRVGFAQLVDPLGAAGPLRTRGAVVRSGQVPGELAADVLTPAGDRSGTTAAFRVQRGPAMTADGRFGLEVKSDATGYEGRRLRCTIALANTDPVSFESTLVRGPQGGIQAVFEANGLPVPGGAIPASSVTLTIS